eukprot:1755048-Alexandrium_andersonii.AAC.1
MLAVDSACAFLVAAGSVVSRPKCVHVASSTTLWAKLRALPSRVLGGPLPATHHARDLGAHLSMGVTSVGATLTTR